MMSASSTDPQTTDNNNAAAVHPDDVTIREYDDTSSSDRTTLMSLVRELQGHEVIIYDRMKPPDDLEDETYLYYLRESCREDSGIILFAETNTNDNPKERKTLVLGYAVVLTKVNMDRIEEKEYIYGEIAELAVTKTARGQGIGPLLMKACEDKVKEAGVSYLRTEVLASNTGARGSYTSCVRDESARSGRLDD